MIRKVDKRKKYLAEKVHDILLHEFINNEWDWQLKLTVAKSKSFFQITSALINEAKESQGVDKDDIEVIERKIISEIAKKEALDVQDLEPLPQDLLRV